MYPTEFIKEKWNKITYPIKFTFVSSVVMGLIVHLFMITNLLPNHDSIALYNYNYPFNLWSIALGRWFAFIPGLLSSNILLPWTRGFFLINYLALSSCLIVKCLKINNKLHCFLISSLLVSFPVISNIFQYYSTSIIFSILLACFSIYFTLYVKYGFLLGILFISFSLAIYQASFSIASGLAILILIIDIIQTNLSFKKIIKKGFKLFSILFFGLILYLIILRITLTITQIELTSYQGINEIGKISISIIPKLIIHTYTSIIDFFLRDNYGIHQLFSFNSGFLFMRFALILLFLSSFFIFIVIIIQKKIYNNKAIFLLLLVLLLLFPLSCNLIYLMNPQEIYLNLFYGLVLLPIVPVILMENVIKLKFLSLLQQLSCWIITIVLSMMIFNYNIISNKVYIAAQIVNMQTTAYSIELITRIQNIENYSLEAPIIFYGESGKTINEHIIFNDLHGFHLSRVSNLYIHSYNYLYNAHGAYMHNLLGFRNRIIFGTSDIIEKYNLQQILNQMPEYPFQGSIQKINDIILIKFSE